MNINYFPSDKRPLAQLFFMLILLLSCFAFFSLLSFLLIEFIFGAQYTSILNISRIEDKPQQIFMLKLIQSLSTIGIFIAPVLIAKIMAPKNNLPLQISILPKSTHWVVTLLLMLAFLPLTQWMVGLNEKMSLPGFLNDLELWMRAAETRAKELTDVFLKMPNHRHYLLNLIVIALLPAIGEELLFRGFLQNNFALMLKNHHAGIWLSAFIFSAIHMQFFGFFPRLFLGALFGYLLFFSGNLWLPIIGHFFNNALAVTVSYLIQINQLSEDVEHLGETPSTYPLIVFGSILGLWLLFQLKKTNSKPLAN